MSGPASGAARCHKWYYGHRFKPVVEALSATGELPITDSAAADGALTPHPEVHELHHTCVALVIAKGAQQYEVVEHLGHTNVQTTINTYGHLFRNVRQRIRVASKTPGGGPALGWLRILAAYPRPGPRGSRSSEPANRV